MRLTDSSELEMKRVGPLALVTGGAVRLGREVSRSLAASGYRLAIHYHSSETAAESLIGELESQGMEATAFAADLTQEGDCECLIDRVVAQCGPVQILVNSAALFEKGSLHDTESGAWALQMQLNLRAPFLLTRHFAAQLPDDLSGSVLNILDARLRRPAGDYLVYRLTKAALLHLTECLAIELAPRIRVNGLAPGAILPHAGESRKEMQLRLAMEVPLPLEGGAQAIGRCAVELLTNPFLTGQITYLDGGQFL